MQKTNDRGKELSFYADLIIDTFNRKTGFPYPYYIGALGYAGQIATFYSDNMYHLFIQEKGKYKEICSDSDVKGYIEKAIRFITKKDIYTYDDIRRIVNE